GSSAMPDKKNPIICERVTGLARVLRGNAMAAMENVALWHERDISHSSVERVIVPDSTILLDYMLEKMVGVVDGLVVKTDNMMDNINKNRGIIFSQRVLLELINKGLDRFKAYDLVQQCAHTMEGGFHFKEALMSNNQICRILTKEEIEACFDMKYHTKHVDRIFKKVGI
ncbi:MAG: adenylosuccinate lyase, partial [Candidatus Omnitrophica bacterium]|nr:adenylosuccinate lyase [Candidatus Omnitrophota bacterium]